MKNAMFIVLFAALTSYGQSCGCDYTFGSSTTTIDGNSYSFSPGDTICIEDGVRGRIRFKNIQGSALSPIIIINCGGQVEIDPGTYSYGMKLQNCDYVHITGTGDSGTEYGFFIESASGYAVPIEDLSNHFEMDHIKVEDSGNYAIYYKNDPECDSSANKGFFTMEDCSIHDNFITACHKGIRIGHIDYDIGVDETCGTLYPHGAEGLKIYNNQIDDMTGGDGIRVYGAEVEIYNNSITNIAGRGITVGTHCEVYAEGNIIGDSEDEGFRALGSGSYELYNNVFYNNGDATHEAIEFAFDDHDGDSLGNVLNFSNNTVVSSANYNFSIIEPDNATSTCTIQNNIFCEPGSASSSSPYEPYLNISDTTSFYIYKNLFEDTLSQLEFVDANNDDYHLTHKSPAINYGESYFYAYDLEDETRDLAGSTDAGAYEYVPERIAYFEQIPLQGLYVNDFKDILGDSTEENQLLEYAQNWGFNYLVIYNLSYIDNNMYDLTDPSESSVLAEFIENAKTNYGIVQLAAVGEKDASFDKIESYNDIYDGNWYRQFDVLNLEFEFWANTSGSTFSYYCSTYLTPNGYPCTTVGAYNFYLDQLELIDQRVIDMGLVNEIYLGSQDDTMSTELAENCDRILLHHYRTSDEYNNGNSIYNYKVDRIRAIALSNRQPAVMPIFSAMDNHMGPWLDTNSIEQPMDTWYNGQNAYYADTSAGVQDLDIAGYQWYRYTNLYEITGSGSRASQSFNQNTNEYEDIPQSKEQEVEVDVELALKVYPTVFDNQLIVELPDMIESYQCVLSQSNGRLMHSCVLNESYNLIEFSNLESGIYFIIVIDSQGRAATKKLIKVNL